MKFGIAQWARRMTRMLRVGFREEEPAPVLSMSPMQSQESDSPEGHLASFEDVDNMRPAFELLRVDWCGSEAAAKACVAELEGSKYVVFVKQGEQDSDIYRAVMLRAREAAKRDEIDVYTVNPVVLLALVRERMQAKDVKQRTTRTRNLGARSAVRVGFHDLAAWGVRNGASDMHLNIDTTAAISHVSATIDGQYTTPKQLSMPTERLIEMGNVAWLDVHGGNGLFLDMTNEQQGRLYEVVDDRSYMLRWGSFVADKGPSVTLRILDMDAKVEPVDMTTLGFLPTHIAKFERCLQSQGGAIVTGGIPGSGKTVTNAQLIVRLPETRKVMTIEDPVELTIPRALAASVSRSLDGSDRDTMRSKLMALKRAAASDVFLGEIRDQLTGSAFQDIVLSGSSLYTTTHVGHALSIPQRFASSEIGVPRTTLGTPGVLKLLSHQALMPVTCDCALPADSLLEGAADRLGVRRTRDDWARYLDTIEALYDFDSGRLKVRNAQGCEKCRTKGIPELFGYAGRTVVAEMFEPSSDPDALRAISSGDELRLREIYAGHRTAAYDHPDMEGKTTMDCAVYKMSQSMIDPRDIEPHFQAFATLLRDRKRK
ncbi:ATPase, T2SS/T4P/T4SS family [Achromobacter aegrifaciens]|uniref:ATPase, T2SS/T4P/T4SS family n=1 Tax=Achromobacter aegrifaciens TaxID=1287736 RepID=UPI0027B89D9F|nr:ATPase, T2SS/T4P/T4SS family [Achromobacter aegrifaciens]WLW63628.1 ATPase, T2SS/T4P/T4SS family [Achromobacter aegrifaciens]